MVLLTICYVILFYMLLLLFSLYGENNCCFYFFPVRWQGVSFIMRSGNYSVSPFTFTIITCRNMIFQGCYQYLACFSLQVMTFDFDSASSLNLVDICNKIDRPAFYVLLTFCFIHSETGADYWNFFEESTRGNKM